MLRSTSPDLCSHLEELLAARKDISLVLWSHRDILRSLHDDDFYSCLPGDILRLSRNITHTAFAPKGWVPGAPLIGGHPPAPQVTKYLFPYSILRTISLFLSSVRNIQVEQMRAGLLGALGVSRGLTASSAQTVSLSGSAFPSSSSPPEGVTQDQPTYNVKGHDANDLDKDQAHTMDEDGTVHGSMTSFTGKSEEEDVVAITRSTMHTDRFSKNQTNNSSIVKKPRVIDMNYGFSSDSSDDSTDDD